MSLVYTLGLFIYTVKLFHKASYQGKCLRKEMENYGHGDRDAAASNFQSFDPWGGRNLSLHHLTNGLNSQSSLDTQLKLLIH